MRCQRLVLDIRWWAHVSNSEVFQRSGLSIGDILRHRRLSLFGHVARLGPVVPAHDAASDGGYLRRQKGHLVKITGSPSQRLAQQSLGGCQRSTTTRCGDLRSPVVTERSDGHSDYATTMMTMKDVILVSKMEGNTNFSRHLQAVRNRDC